MAKLVKKPDFSSLSINDLLEARDAYHVHLANLENVVGTAIGKYLIRQRDPDAKDPNNELANPGSNVRTLSNSIVRKWSWPCVLVFVDNWSTPATLAKHPEAYVPPRLYLPDGRVIPTCVVYAKRDRAAPAPLYDLQFANGLMGGGYPVLSHVQGEDRIGSIGCLVTDGHSVFAITNRHVAGPMGQESFTIVDGERMRIGESVARDVGKLDFTEAYPGWPGLRTQINLDAGLVRLDSLADWTAQIFGIGEVGELIDANIDTLSLDVIDSPVRAFGGASGELTGSIKALFYRYRSVGGFDYVSDFLVGPRDKATSVDTRPGDSGTVWFWDAAEDCEQLDRSRRLRPFAMQWGGHVLSGPGSQDQSQFALTSSLATICRTLDLEIVPDWETGHSEYWGKVGHYKVGAMACNVIRNTKLSKLMQANIERVAISDQNLVEGNLPMNRQQSFVALADVPDLIWRSKRGKDKANHFADMDEEGKGAFAGQTLLDLFLDDPATLNTATWTDFYAALGVTKDAHRGALPFRVRQLYEEMVDAASKQSISRFVAAAGVLSHYVGDACQPLHVSHLHHGRPGNPGEDRVHSIYETKMLDRFVVELIAGINDQLAGKTIAQNFTGGQEAANAAVDLMLFTVQTLPPIDVINAFNARDGRERIPFMWETLRVRTIECMVEGILYLAEMWESAWLEGNGDRIVSARLTERSKTTLRNLYMRKTWVESDWLKNMRFN